jgi:S1-C subfamily serine protease
MTATRRETPVVSAVSAHMADAVDRAAASLVHVSGRSRYGATGTVHASELVIAADHTLERDDSITVETRDGRALPAALLGRDPATDLAVLRVADLDLDPASPAAGPARVGQLVLAVGRPAGQAVMASLGVVSALGGPLRTARGPVLEQFIRTDATPYPGFSGGALIDTEGAVLGILTSGLIRGVGLAIPLSIASRVAGTLARQGHVTRPYLGVGAQAVRLPDGQRAAGVPEQGLLVLSLGDDSPAARGGVLLGDIIIALDGRPVADVDTLQALLAERSVGAPCAIEVVRGGARTAVTVRLGQRPADTRS